LKLQYDEQLSNFALKFNMRRYTLSLAFALIVMYDATGVRRHAGRARQLSLATSFSALCTRVR
jgi:acid phosphatase family membrane protein YuiD